MCFCFSLATEYSINRKKIAMSKCALRGSIMQKLFVRVYLQEVDCTS